MTRMQAFLRGVAQVFVLAPEPQVLALPSDAEAIRSDWETVLGDFNHALSFGQGQAAAVVTGGGHPLQSVRTARGRSYRDVVRLRRGVAARRRPGCENQVRGTGPGARA